MQTPAKLKIDSLEELAGQVQHHFQERFIRLGEGFVCKECDVQILFVKAHIDVHVRAADQSCKGPGMTGAAQIPYCPRCEERPNEIGCIHVPIEYFRPREIIVIMPTHHGSRFILGY